MPRPQASPALAVRSYPSGEKVSCALVQPAEPMLNPTGSIPVNYRFAGRQCAARISFLERPRRSVDESTGAPVAAAACCRRPTPLGAACCSLRTARRRSRSSGARAPSTARVSASARLLSPSPSVATDGCMTSPRPAHKPRPRSPEQPASEADAPRGASATDERARVLQEHAAAARRPPVKRQRRMVRSDAGEAAAAAGLAAQNCREDELASTAASTPAGSVDATDNKENVVVVDSEEKQMDGAPEGDLFLVNVLTSDEFQPSADLEQELKQLDELLALIKGQEQGDDDVSWGMQYHAVDSVRRLAIHHTQEIQQRLARALSLLVLPSVSSLRSAMSRNAVLCVEDLIRALPTDISEHFDTIVPLLIQRACNEKQFIRDAAKEVLDTTVQVVSNASLLETLLQTSGDKNPQAVSVAGVYATKCIQAMDKDHLKTFATETHQIFLEEMAAFLNCKVVECKAHARRALQYTRKTIGDTAFVALAKAQLTGGAQFDVLRASEERKNPAGPKGRPSIRERMMQMKKAKGLPAGGNSGDDVPVVVVAAPTPSGPAAPSSSSADVASSL